MNRVRGFVRVASFVFVCTSWVACGPGEHHEAPASSHTEESALVEEAPAGLVGTSWRLVKFRSMDDTTLVPDDPGKYTLAFGGDGSVAVRIDCNRGQGSWTSEAEHQLELGPLALTRAMCPPAPLTDRLEKDWSYVRSYVLEDGHLYLSLMADGGIYEFEPAPAAE